jgi:hypothetical protein
MPASRERPKSRTGSPPSQYSPVCTVVAPVTLAAVATGATVLVVNEAGAVGTLGTAPVTLVVAAPRTTRRPPSVPVDPAPMLASASMVAPATDAEPLPDPDVADPEPAATVVSSGVPERNVCDWPGAME